MSKKNRRRKGITSAGVPKLTPEEQKKHDAEYTKWLDDELKAHNEMADYIREMDLTVGGVGYKCPPLNEDGSMKTDDD